MSSDFSSKEFNSFKLSFPKGTKIPISEGTYYNTYKVLVGIRWYVLKEPNNLYKDTLFVAQLLEKEFEIMQQFNHPNLAKGIYLIKDNDQTVLILEYIDGITLEQLLDKEKIPFSSFNRFFFKFLDDITSALAKLHESKIFHGDLSPKNIMYSESENRFVLIDFGHSVHRNYTNVGGGTAEFYNKDVVNQSEQSDLFSLGKVLDWSKSHYKQIDNQKQLDELLFKLLNGSFSNITELVRFIDSNREKKK